MITVLCIVWIAANLGVIVVLKICVHYSIGNTESADAKPKSSSSLNKTPKRKRHIVYIECLIVLN